MSAVFVQALDTLILRGNKLFGDPGSYGESWIPPWPSVMAGALRSRMLVDAGIDLTAFARGAAPHPQLGTPAAPGSFTLAAFLLARRDAAGHLEPLVALPADLSVSEAADGAVHVRALSPVAFTHSGLAAGEGKDATVPARLQSSAPLPYLPVLAETERSKPAAGYWLGESGWQRYLAGQMPQPEELVASSALWRIDERIGIGLDAATGRAADGKLFSLQAVALLPGVGFVAVVHGATPPTDGSLRLGGDGRAAALQATGWTPPEPDYAAMAAAKRCRVVLTTPGLFTSGWLPNGCTQTRDGAVQFNLHGVSGTLVCAAVARAETLSGWDLANGWPKPAQRAAPSGSVYWLEDLDATAEALRKLVETGLWRDPCEDDARRAEGFNRFTFAAWQPRTDHV